MLQAIAPAIIDGLVKGLKGVNKDLSVDLTRTPKATLTHLEELFLRSPRLDPSPHVNLQEVAELDIGLSQRLMTRFRLEIFSLAFVFCFYL